MAKAKDKSPFLHNKKETQKTLTVTESLAELKQWFDRHHRLIILLTSLVTLSLTCNAIRLILSGQW